MGDWPFGRGLGRDQPRRGFAAHHIVAGPPQRHSLLGETDPVVLLTVRLD
jgi:hypothetical protein